MEVILLERIEKLGQMGDVVNVKPGFARNFLLPREKALRATDENKKRFEGQRAQLEAENLKLREEADAVAKKMEGLSVILIRQAGEAGQLYGSVSARDIAAQVSEAGFTVARSQVNLAHPIKTLGLFNVSVALHPEVTSTVTVNVARSADEATIQAETGYAVTGGDDEADAEAAAELEAVFEAGAAEAAAEELAATEAENAGEEAPAEDASDDAGEDDKAE
jgi:large subunit ribosomal protein L9